MVVHALVSLSPYWRKVHILRFHAKMVIKIGHDITVSAHQEFSNATHCIEDNNTVIESDSNHSKIIMVCKPGLQKNYNFWNFYTKLNKNDFKIPNDDRNWKVQSQTDSEGYYQRARVCVFSDQHHNGSLWFFIDLFYNVHFGQTKLK